ncbi:CsgG/HfaB family protein [Candidatus Magnetominusculus xianensis]|uniref:Curli production assembly protein CsgG n=1 Tax=Candidatus Magnetominusculus xianensis TaxID=1748249 RepID=A0ABR5SDP5_9BACT|nr:CsgG/HfaB family protein [Candidatus Magnetominusculus xianensis]KWT83450.1 curli production assembly protein CsgG [Candidatus Magnetominusculus xianensis]
MKKVLVAALVLILSVTAGVMSAYAEEKPRLGVLRFTNDTRASWWSSGTGRDLQDMLASELVSTKSFQVLERKELDAVLGEQDLGASGRIDPATKAKIGKIKGAQYLIAATVSAFEENTEGQGGGIGIAGINIGGSEAKAYMAVDLKVIDATTGEVVDARTVEASSKSSASSISGGYGMFSGGMSQHKKTPVGKAIRACIIEISEYLQCSLTKKGSGCMAAYDAKEDKRKDTTKKSIELE